MKEKLNVLLVNDSFPPVIDGVSNTVLNYASIISKKYGNVIVATPDYPNVKDDYPFTVKRYPSIDTTKLVGYRAGNPFSIEYLSQFEFENIDIIHVHCPITSLFLARSIREITHKPVVLTYHTKFDIDIQRDIHSKRLQDVAIKALVNNINAADEVWAVSHGAGENLKSLGYNGDYLVMENGVDFEKGKASDEEIKTFRQKYNLNDTVPTYLFVGRIMWYKGLKIIIDALEKLKLKNQKFKMIFVGDGGDFNEVKAYVSEKGLDNEVIFTGSISDRHLLKTVFSSCDLFLFPSTFDTNGIVVREAAASALASVLVKNSCASEGVSDGLNALLIDENSDSLSTLLLKHGYDLDYYHLIGQNAQEQLYKSWESSVDKAVERYYEIIEKYQYNKANYVNPIFNESVFTLLSNMSDKLADIKITKKHIDETISNVQSALSESIDESFENTSKKIDDVHQHIEQTVASTKTFISEIHNNVDKKIDNIESNINKQIDNLKKESIKLKKQIIDMFDRYL